MTLVMLEEKFYDIYKMVANIPPFAKINSMCPLYLKLEIDIALDSNAYLSWISPFIKYSNLSIPKDNYHIDKILEGNLHSEIVRETETHIVLRVMMKNMEEFMKIEHKYCINPNKYDFNMD